MICKEKEFLTILNLKYWYKDKKTKTFIWKALFVHGDKYDYYETLYINNKTKVKIGCRVKGHDVFTQRTNDHIYGHGCSKCKGCGCQKCNKNKGEEAIRKFLNEKEIEFEEQKKFKGCKYKQLLKFDFYIPKYNLCIESDGNIHFEKINWTGKMTDEEMEENLKSNQLRDQIKNDYCKNNKINLLRIRYDENIEEKLTEYFKENYIKI